MGEERGAGEAVPGVAPGRGRVGVARVVEVGGQVFEVRSDGAGGAQYDWVSGPNEGYGFAVSPAPGSDAGHEDNIRAFLSMIDPATGYIAED